MPLFPHRRAAFLGKQKAAPPATGLWTPARLGTAFRLGLRGMQADGSSKGAEVLNTSGAVDQWSDWSGHADHITATSTNRPALVTNVLNGGPIVRFDGTDDRLQKTGMAAVDPAGGLAFFLVAKFSAVGGDALIDFSPSTATNSGVLFFQESTVLTIRIAGIATDCSVIMVDTGWHLFEAIITPTDQTIYIDTASAATQTATTPSLSLTNFQLGALWGDIYNLNGDIAQCHVITGSAAYDATNRAKAQGELAWAWGLQSAPNTGILGSGHAYSLAAPT